MSDPRAGLIIAAEDATAAAFSSANRNINTLESNARRASGGIAGTFRSAGIAVTSFRGALASLGVVISGRALFSWMSNAVQATTAIGEQREEVLRAKQAFADFKTASDSLGESLAARLSPAISAVAKALDEFRRNRDGPSVLDTFNEKLAQARKDLESLPLEISRMEAFRGTGGEGAQALAALEQRLAKAKEDAGILGAAESGGATLTDAEVKASRELADAVALERERFAGEEREALQNQREKDARDELELVTAVYAERDRLALAEQDAAEEAAQKEEQQAERRRELLEGHLDDVKLNLLSEVEFEAEMYARQQEVLDQSLQQKLISEEEHSRRSVDLERQTSEKIKKIRKDEEQSDRQLRLAKLGGYANLVAGIAAITSVGAEDSKKKFDTHKKIATAAAIVDTYAAVAYALRNPPGPPFSIPQAVAAGLFGFAQVKAIQSTTWSGGGAGGFGGVGGGGGVEAVATPNDRTAGLISGDGSGGRGGTIINVHITPGIMGRVDPESARIVARAIGDELQNSDFEFIPRNSRQVLTIRGDGVQDESRP